MFLSVAGTVVARGALYANEPMSLGITGNRTVETNLKGIHVDQS